MKSQSKQLTQLKAKLQSLLKLAAKVRRYIVQVLDLEAKIEQLQGQQLAIAYQPTDEFDRFPYKVIANGVVVNEFNTHIRAEHWLIKYGFTMYRANGGFNEQYLSVV